MAAAAKTLRTPATTARRKAPTPTSYAEKKPVQRNASILDFFPKKKDMSLFEGDAELEETINAEEHGDGPQSGEGSPSKDRFNEDDTPVKRRKLSPAGGATGVPEEEYSVLNETENKTTLLPANAALRRPKVAAGFLIDSSDEESDGEEKGKPPHKEAINGASRPATDERQKTIARNDLDTKQSRSTNGTVTSSNHTPKSGDELLMNEEGADEKLDDATPDGPDTSPNDQVLEDMDPDKFPEEYIDGVEDESLLEGEEYRAMRFMEEQARLEAEGEAEAENSSCQEIKADLCPICSGSLAGTSAEEATAHVNGCLDGKPTPLPATIIKNTTEKSSAPGQTQEGEPDRKRFSHAAIARPGQCNPITLVAASSAQTAPINTPSAFAKLMASHAEDAAWKSAAAAEHASRGKAAHERTCPFYKIMPGMPVCVDAFRYGAVEGCVAYFLSHFHSDHYIGLTARWSHGPIYCSKVTGSLVRTQLRTAAKYVVELDFDEKVPVPGADGVFVTMIPANHCPGSSLFLLEREGGRGRAQRILHCGDFRACAAHVRHPRLKPEIVLNGKTKQQRIDVCYLDTTYLNPRYSFPPQDDVIRACADVCAALQTGGEAEWDALLERRVGGPPGGVKAFFSEAKPPTAPVGPVGPEDAFSALKRAPSDRLLVVCGTYSIGKERLCVAIARALHTKIYATPAKQRICRQLDDSLLSRLLTSDPREAQVHMQALAEIRAETLQDYLASHAPHFNRVVGFRPSGWTFARQPAGVSAALQPGGLLTAQLLHGRGGWRPRFAVRDLRPQRGGTRTAVCLGVPYSEHSSFRELAVFLMALRVERVVPTVNVGSEASRARMRGWTDKWLGERRKGGLVTILEGEEPDGQERLWDGKGEGGGVYW